MKPTSSTFIILISLFTATLSAQQPGDLDTTFGPNGIVTPVLGGSEGITSVAIQPDEKIITGGYSNFNSTGKDFTLIRYNQDGSIDSSFGTDGLVTTDFSGSTDDLQAITLQPDGKIVAVGKSISSFALARYLTDGSLDTSFGMSGKLTIALGFWGSGAWSVAMQPDGKIIAAGFEDNDPVFSITRRDFALIRCNQDGALDTTFSGDGIATTPFTLNGMSEAYSVTMQADGKIVAAGYTTNPGSSGSDDFALARYNTDGTLDSTFSANGKLTTDFGSYADRAYSVALQGDEKVVVGGSARTSASLGYFGIARYNTDGTLDTTFSSDGKLSTTLFGNLDAVRSVAIQPDGKIVAAGNAGAFGISFFGIARYHANGTLDNTFSTDGIVTTPPGAATSTILQHDGKILVAGATNNDFSIARYISGLDVVEIEGTVLTGLGGPVPGVTVTLSGDYSQTATTDNTGSYSFTVPQGGSYTITPSKNNDVVTNNGVSSIDILLTRQHILGTPFSSPFKIIAADVDASNSVSTLDILLIRSMILQNIATFPNGRLWSFVPSDHVFADPVNPFPFPSSRTYTNLQQSITNEDFIGIKLGDVNDSWDANIP